MKERDWSVSVDGKLMATYPTREQCVTFCHLNGYVVEGRGKKYFVDGVRICQNGRVV